MRRYGLILLPLAACTSDANHLGNPFLLPVSGLSTAADNAAYNERRGRVELFVKTNHPALLDDIAAGGGTTLTQAMDMAQIDPIDRPARLIQLRADFALYHASPDALVTALMIYGR